MRIGRTPETNRTRVVVLTADAEFENRCARPLAPASAIDLVTCSGRLPEQGDTLDVSGATVVVVDLDAGLARGDVGARSG